jgi:hypothetical protein
LENFFHFFLRHQTNLIVIAVEQFFHQQSLPSFISDDSVGEKPKYMKISPSLLVIDDSGARRRIGKTSDGNKTKSSRCVFFFSRFFWFYLSNCPSICFPGYVKETGE